jgi:hypothetical protein
VFSLLWCGWLNGEGGCECSFGGDGGMVSGEKGGGLVLADRVAKEGRAWVDVCMDGWGRVCKRLPGDLRTWWWSLKGNAGSVEEGVVW